SRRSDRRRRLVRDESSATSSDRPVVMELGSRAVAREETASGALDDGDDSLAAGGADGDQATAARTLRVQHLGQGGQDASAGRSEGVPGCQRGAVDVELVAVDRSERSVQAQPLAAEL